MEALSGFISTTVYYNPPNLYNTKEESLLYIIQITYNGVAQSKV